MQSCRFCGKIVVDDAGNKTEDFGGVRNNRVVWSRCMRAFEFSLRF